MITEALYHKTLDDGRIVCVIPKIFTYRITVSRDEWGYDEGWCYHSAVVALAAAEEWDGSDTPIGWHKEVVSGRRCIDGKIFTGDQYARGEHLE